MPVQERTGDGGLWILKNVRSDDGTLAASGTATEYSAPFNVGAGDVWSLHFEIEEIAATYASTVTLWVSNRPAPALDSDTDWVQMVAAHGWDGFPVLTGGNPTGGDEKDFVDVSVSGGLKYRVKVVQDGDATGDAWLNMWAVIKGAR